MDDESILRPNVAGNCDPDRKKVGCSTSKLTRPLWVRPLKACHPGLHLRGPYVGVELSMPPEGTIFQSNRREVTSRRKPPLNVGMTCFCEMQFVKTAPPPQKRKNRTGKERERVVGGKIRKDVLLNKNPNSSNRSRTRGNSSCNRGP